MTEPIGIKVDISPGELMDKISILEIKSEKLVLPTQLKNIRKELALLTAARDKNLVLTDKLRTLCVELKLVNEHLWSLEDDIRYQEKNACFDNRFIEIARDIYQSNDMRSLLKREINFLLGAVLVEEKSYPEYIHAAAVGIASTDG